MVFECYSQTECVQHLESYKGALEARCILCWCYDYKSNLNNAYLLVAAGIPNDDHRGR